MGNSGELKDVRVATVGVSVSVKGEITGSEDIVVDGQVDGCIDVPEHVLTIGPNARVQAHIHAKTVIVFGSVIGTVIAEEKAEIRKTASLDGALTCGVLSVQEGATITGMIETTNRRASAGRTSAEKVA